MFLVSGLDLCSPLAHLYAYPHPYSLTLKKKKIKKKRKKNTFLRQNSRQVHHHDRSELFITINRQLRSDKNHTIIAKLS